MADWSIKIVQTKQGVAFQPDIPGYIPGDPLPAQQDDLVTWNNTTADTHQPWPTDANYNPLSVKRTSQQYMSDPIPANQSSRPAYDVAQPNTTPKPTTWTVYYYCKTHPTEVSERGRIIANVYPTS